MDENLLQQKVQDLEQKLNLLQEEFDKLRKSDRYVFAKDIEMQDGRNFQFAVGYGTKIGTAADQELAFFGQEPVPQQTNVTTASGCAGDADDKVNQLITRLINLGLIAGP